jgi:cellulose synthase/poly-beta-1,6-N-acetylglucosamine synthase-like glycosyltransferase
MDAYLLVLLAAAARADQEGAPPPPGEPLRFAVLVPGHDEEGAIGDTLRALDALDYPPDRVDVVVIADNCSDATAAIARAAGAIVLERTDPERRGKGHALNWALDRLRETSDAEAIAFVDADCLPTPNLLRAADARLRGGAVAVQADYVVSNAEASATSALRYAAFALFNRVRPLGRERLGLSAGLVGTGMAFRRPVIERLRFDTASVTEDGELHLRLLEQGDRVAFVPEAAVLSPMPTAAADTTAQQTRWEGGRVEVLRTRRRGLLARGNRPLRAALFEEVVPPQALLAVLHLAGAAGALASGRRGLRRIAAAELAAQAAFVLGGLRVARAPGGVYRALAAAPALMAQKVALYARLARRGGPTEWERTTRPG